MSLEKRHSAMRRFEKDAQGHYHYTGSWYVLRRDHKKETGASLTLTLAGAVCWIAMGFLPADCHRVWYVMWPFALALAGLIPMVFFVVSACASRWVLMEHEHSACMTWSAVGAVVSSALAGLSVIAQAVFMALNRGGESPVWNAAFLILALAVAVCSGAVHRRRLTWRWDNISEAQRAKRFDK